MKNNIYFIFNLIHRFLQRTLRFASLGVKGLVINENQEVLLVEHTYIEGWHLPGGRVDNGESPRQAIKRELAEEGGIHVNDNDLKLFAIYTHFIYGASDYPVLYVATVFTATPKSKPCAEIKQAKWFHYTQLPPETTESTRLRIAEYFNPQNLHQNPTDFW